MQSKEYQDAHKAVQELNSYLKQQNKQVTSAKERLETKKRAQIAKERIQRSQMDKNKLKQNFEHYNLK